MKIYEGKVGLIGEGTFIPGGYGGSATRLSVLEIGNHSFKSIMLHEYLSNYIKSGDDVRVLIEKGIIRSHYIAAVEVNGKKYKVGGNIIFIGSLAKTLAFCLAVVVIIGFGMSMKFIAALLCIAFAVYEFKKYYEYINF